MKPVIATCLFLLLFACCVKSYGQGENNIWCFGTNSGLDFNAGPPAAYTSVISTSEGCASVCDANGQLLFYASPTRAYDKNHNVMPNGSGLIGGGSCTQGAAIIRSHGDSNLYYLFTMEAVPTNTARLVYSVVDMTLNAGLGDIVIGQKNIVLDSGFIEKMIVVQGRGCFQWLLVHDRSSPVFHAFKVDASGLNVAPVISTSGFHYGFDCYSLGEMKVANGDSLLGLANYYHPSIELHHFDNATGIVSGAINLDTIVSGGDQWYGASFSPDGRKFYASPYIGAVQALYQYDVSLLPDVAAVQASRTVINNNRYYGMRIGPDSKVYMIYGGAISVINNPNVAGPACNVTPTGLSESGLIFTNVFVPVKTNFLAANVAHDTTVCLGIIPYTAQGPPGFYTYLWSDGNITQNDTFTSPGTKWVTSARYCEIQVDTFHVHAGLLDTTTASLDTSACAAVTAVTLSAPGNYTVYSWSDNTVLQTDTFTASGTKWVYAQSGCDLLIDTFHLTAKLDTTKLAFDTSICFVNNVPVLSAPAGYTSYLWSDGFILQQDTFGMPGTKWVRAQTGCDLLIDTFTVHDHRDTTKMVMDTTHCVAYSPITIYAPGGYLTYLWSDGKAQQADTFFATTTKWVTALNGCNLLIDTVHFIATTVPQDSITMHGADTSICFEAGALNVSAPPGYTYYLWNDGATSQANTFASPATKWVYAQKLCALLIDTFIVSAQPTDTIASHIDTMICFSAGVLLSAVAGYDTYLWSDGMNTQSDTFSYTSTKQVYAHKACAERIDSFHVQFINDLSVDLGPDTALCKGEVIVLNATSAYNIAKYDWQDNNTAAVYKVTEGGDYIVKVSVGPCSVSDTVRVHQKVMDIKLGSGLIPCHETEISLDAGVDSSSYLWQDGSTNRTLKATKAGLYSVKVTQGLCSATAKVNVQFEDCPCTVVIPTAFSPNGDGRNDKFGAAISCTLNSYKLMIYSRWGNRVFYSENVNDKWDGTVKGIAVDGDVYNYYIEFKDGENKVYYYKGDLTVVR